MRALRDDDHVVVVGAGLGGWRLVEGLRRHGFAGRISLLGAETHLPYDRPPLSKQVLVGKWEPASTGLVDSERLESLEVHALLGSPAVALDPATSTVTLADARTVTGSHVVVATGAAARRIPFTAGDRLHVLRTREDAAGLLAAARAVEPGSRVVVIGGGFVGAEVATSLKARGLEPLVLEAMPLALVNVLGDEVAGWLGGLAESAGIELRTRQVVADVDSAGEGLVVRLGDAGVVEAALVVLAVGAVPNDRWLADSGLEVRNGLVTDAGLRAGESTWAIGDVARFAWRHDPFVEEVRVEHWQVATDHAAFLARALVEGGDQALRMTPYFWSDQYGAKIQVLGHPSSGDEVALLAGGPDQGRFLAAHVREGRVAALTALSSPRALMLSKSLVDDHVALDEALRLTPWSS